MECLKTGCHAYLQEYDIYVYGDAHVVRIAPATSVLVLRIVEASIARPVHPLLHVDVDYIEEWFDRTTTSGHHPSTLIAKLWHYHDHGGIPVEEAAKLYNRTIPQED